MKVRKKLLFIEDYEDDYLLLLRHLKSAGHAVEAKRVDEKVDLEKALQEKWDAIICDNKLPGLNAYEALKLVRSVDQDLPFLIVSGCLSDDEALEAMNAGANDYIIKGDYNRFLPALERGIRNHQVKLEKKQVEEQLINREEAFYLLTENAQDLLILSDSQGQILYISASSKKMAGYDPHEVLGRNIKEFLIEEDQVKYENILFQINQGARRTFRSTYQVIKADGSILYLENLTKPYQDREGNIRIISTSRDLSESLQYRDKISKSERKFSIAAEELHQLILYANAPIFGLNWNGEIIEWNSSAEELTGYLRHEVIGKKIFNKIVPEHYQAPLTKIFKDALLDKKASNYEIPIVSKDGKTKSILFSSTPRKNDDGEIIGVLCYGQDNTIRKEYRENLEKKVEERTSQLNEALKKEKKLADLKTRFVSMASHEFKIPLTTISIAADYISRYYSKAPEEKIQERVIKIKEQVNNMVFLLNDVLTLDRNQDGKLKSNAGEINIHDFISKVKTELETSDVYEHKIKVEKDLPEKLFINTDPVLLKNISTNLLNNAMKYSPGEDHVVWKIKSTEKAIEFIFQDFGIGIPEQEQDEIFSPFVRGSNTSTIEGTGLGLSIVKRSTETLGGDVQLIESSSKGTIFKLSLPIKNR